MKCEHCDGHSNCVHVYVIVATMLTIHVHVGTTLRNVTANAYVESHNKLVNIQPLSQQIRRFSSN